MARALYSPEYKSKLVLEALKEEQTVEQIAARENINPNMLRNWRREFLANASKVFDDGNSQAAKEAARKEVRLEKERKRMLRTIGQLTMERDFLQECFQINGRPIPTLDDRRE